MREDSVILPMKHPLIAPYNHHANILAMLSGYEENIEWFLNHYIQLTFEADRERLDICSTDPSRPFIRSIPLILHNGVSRGFIKSNFNSAVDFIISALQDGYYLYLTVDMYHVGPHNCYLQHHFIHDIFIYGYDLGSGTFNVADCFMGKYSFERTSFESIEKGFMMDESLDWFGGVILLKENTYELECPFDVCTVGKLLLDYLHCRDSRQSNIYIKNTRKLRFGLDAYDALIEHIFGVSYLDHRLFQMVCEHKVVLLELCRYLYRNNYLSCAEPVFGQLRNVLQLSKTLRNKAMKYNYAPSDDGKGDIIGSLRELSSLERAALTHLSENIDISKSAKSFPCDAEVLWNHVCVQYTGKWLDNASRNVRESNDPEASLIVSFYGSSVECRALRDGGYAAFDIYIDGVRKDGAAACSDADADSGPISVFRASDLLTGYHTVEIKRKNAKSAEDCPYINIHSLIFSSDSSREAVPAVFEYAGSDYAAKGDWVGKYGRIGFELPGMNSRLPDYIAVSYLSAGRTKWPENDSRLLRHPDFEHRKTGWVKYNHDRFSVDIAVFRPESRLVTFYLLGYDENCRHSVLEAMDLDNGKTLFNKEYADLDLGMHVSFRIRGRVRFTIRKVNLSNSCVGLCGVFFNE